MIPSPRMAVDEEGAEAGTQVLKKRRRGRRLDSSDNHSWEGQPNSHLVDLRESSQMRRLLIGGAGLFAMIAGGIFFSMKAGKAEEQSPVFSQKNLPVPVTVAETVAKAADPVVSGRSEASFLTEAEPLTRKFLEATTVAELLPLIRHPEVTEPRVRGVYPSGKIKALGMSKFNSASGISVRDSLTSLMVRTLDHEEKPLAFIETPKGLKIDWESWVGWSAMSWEKFLSSKPRSAQVFRVTLSAINYYNFEFSDDSKWHSFRLTSPDQEHSLYGYVERGSPLDQKICPTESATVVTLMLALKFPSEVVSNSQVEIESLVAEGWVEDDPQ
jgi:hypothetical protein